MRLIQFACIAKSVEGEGSLHWVASDGLKRALKSFCLSTVIRIPSFLVTPVIAI